MKNFLENFNVEIIKEFCTRHFHRIMFVILTAIVTTMAVLFNYMTNNGYGSFLNSSGEPAHRYYHDNDSYNRNRNSNNSSRQPWKMQKPSSSHSSKSSSSSGRH